MARFHFVATDILFYGLPIALLAVVLGRNLKSNPKAALIYFAALAGYLGHLAVARYESPGLSALVPIEAPDQLPPTPQITEMNGRSVLQLEAPATLEWTLRGDERELKFSYGLVPETYEEGSTDGCGFTFTLSRDGVVRPIFQRLLQPRDHPEDRGTQQTSLVLPPVAPGERLTLAIDAGPNGNKAWDWAYLSSLGFVRSHAFRSEQFPSFHRLPETANSPYGSLFQNRNGPFYLQLHAPSVLEFALHGGEQRLRFTHGFLAGAYQGGNATDGARFVVLLQPTGGTARTLWERTLEPQTRATDRGPQGADVPLGGFAAGDRLIIRIEPGPAGNISCDWTYVSSLLLQ